jgi:hypothetical protein
VTFYQPRLLRKCALSLLGFIIGAITYKLVVHQRSLTWGDLPVYLVSAVAFVVTWQMIEWFRLLEEELKS